MVAYSECSCRRPVNLQSKMRISIKNGQGIEHAWVGKFVKYTQNTGWASAVYEMLKIRLVIQQYCNRRDIL